MLSGAGAAQKILLGVVAVGATAGVATYASLTSSTPSLSVSTGTVAIAIGAVGTAANRLSVDASEVAPGDTIERGIDLSNAGIHGLSLITLTTTATAGSPLDTDATNGLQMRIDRCSRPWTESGASPAFRYTCGGTMSTVLATRPVIGVNLPLAGLSALDPGGVDHLRLTLRLPAGATGSLQGLSSTIGYAFVGV